MILKRLGIYLTFLKSSGIPRSSVDVASYPNLFGKRMGEAYRGDLVEELISFMTV